MSEPVAEAARWRSDRRAWLALLAVAEAAWLAFLAWMVGQA
jgi:hypothetical protein